MDLLYNKNQSILLILETNKILDKIRKELYYFMKYLNF